MKTNRKGFGLIGLVLALSTISFIAILGWQVYNRQSNSKNSDPVVTKNSQGVDEVPKCESKPIAGTVIFDVVQPAPFIDSRVNEINKDIKASHTTWRDGSIIKIDGKDHSSGKYLAKVEEGSEKAAVAILSNNPNVTFAAQATSSCPVETKVKVE